MTATQNPTPTPALPHRGGGSQNPAAFARARRRTAGPGGFTLLELLVALAVFAVLSVAAYGGLRSVLFTQAAVEADGRRLAQIQMAFYRLEQDIEQMAARGIRDEFGHFHPALESGRSDGDLLTFTRTGWDNPLELQRAALQRLGYRLEQGRLLRLYWDSLDRGELSEPRRIVLLDAVQEAAVRFLDAEDQWQSDWQPAADDPAATDSLPRAVELTLILRDWGEITRLFILPGA